jgi:phosphatidylglycerol:prolipoprotein diacylglycerol transferase
MNTWQTIYQSFNPVALDLGFIKVHWYGLCYIGALFGAYFLAKWFVTKDKLPFTHENIDEYFIWAEVGVILGGRLGFILFYDPNTMWYLTNPWQIFNPFLNGEFVGIRGFSYHGGVIGFLIASVIFAKRAKLNFWALMDLVALSVGPAYFLGRLGNFLNQELFGRVTDVGWAIMVDGALRHPSQLYEGITEGLLVFVILYAIRKRKTFDGELAALYAVLYGAARFGCEFYRQPDIQLGFLFNTEWLTMGMLLSLAFIAAGVIIYVYLRRKVLNHGKAM